MTRNVVLSYGGGVNSTAMTLLILTDERYADLRPGLRLVFAETGDEWPETYAFIEQFERDVLTRHGLRLDRVARTGPTLEAYSTEQGIVPSRMNRWCTDKFKVRPIRAWLPTLPYSETIMLIGFDAGEPHRAKPSETPGITNRFPLIESGLDRQGCLALIRRAGVPEPMKSGCFYCPFQRKAKWVTLARQHPDLYQRAVALDAIGVAQDYPLAHKTLPLHDWIARDLAQDDMFDADEAHCMCGL